MKRWHAWLELARISNLPTVWTNVLAGWLLAGGVWQWGPLAWLLVGGSLMYTAGMILNDAMDVKFDREHRKERPIPSGRITLSTAWGAGVGMLIVGAGICYFGAGACGWLVLALAGAIMAYDAFHKPWAGSVLIMGSCRTLLYLVAGSAVTGGLSWETHHELVAKAVALGGYIVGVSLVARSETVPGATYGPQRMMGLLGLFLPFGASCLSLSRGKVFHHWITTPFWWVLGLLIAILTIVLIVALKRMRTPPRSNIGAAVGILLAGIVVVDALAITIYHPVIAVIFAASMPLLLLWQRKIAAT